MTETFAPSLAAATDTYVGDPPKVILSSFIVGESMASIAKCPTVTRSNMIVWFIVETSISMLLIRLWIEHRGYESCLAKGKVGEEQKAAKEKAIWFNAVLAELLSHLTRQRKFRAPLR
jgi:hypothetical protein